MLSQKRNYYIQLSFTFTSCIVFKSLYFIFFAHELFLNLAVLTNKIQLLLKLPKNKKKLYVRINKIIFLKNKK